MADSDPLDWLPANEAAFLNAMLEAVDQIISDKELRESLIGCVLAEVEDWGKAKLDRETSGQKGH